MVTIVTREHEYRGQYYAAASYSDGSRLRKMGLGRFLEGVGLEVFDGVVEALGTEFTWEQAEILADEWRQLREARRARIEADLVRCPVCGQRVPPAQMMSASLGRCCSDCYDRMSN